jgi:nucleoside-diphosphate-sugar epimerase
MQWLIFGATGYSGNGILEACMKKSISVCAHCRPNSSKRGQLEEKVRAAASPLTTVHVCDFSSEPIEALIKSVQPTNIALCLGTTKEKSSKAKEKGHPHGYEGIDRNLSLLVIQAAIKEKPDARVAYISSMGADKPRGNKYLSARYDVEQELMGSGLEYMIIRPAFLTGLDRQELRRLERVGAFIGDSLLSFGAMLGMKKMQSNFASIDAETLAQGILRASEDPDPAQLLYPQHLRFRLGMR